MVVHNTDLNRSLYRSLVGFRIEEEKYGDACEEGRDYIRVDRAII